MNKKLIFLSILSVLIMLFLAVTYRQFVNDLESYRERVESLRAKQIISADLSANIEKIKLLYYKTMLTSNKIKVLNINIKALREKIKEAGSLITILENGGDHQKNLFLNVAGQDIYAKTYHYKKQNFSIEAIRLKPKITWLSKKSLFLEDLIKERINIMEHGKDMRIPLSHIRDKTALFTKSVDSIFKRMEEDSNKLFYEAQKELSMQSISEKRSKKYYDILIYSAAILLLLSIFLGIYYFVKALRRKLYVDGLTQLYSRVKLEEIPFREESLLFLVDIDDFSDINSLYGNDAGDEVLRCMSIKIKTITPLAEHFRVSGDVFGIYFSTNISYTNINSIKKYIEEIREYIQHQHKKNRVCQEEISVTIGAARGENCFHDAFMALDIANSKSEPYRIFHDESDFKEEIEFNRYWHKELVLALEKDSIVPFFQPIVDVKMQIVNQEALMRLHKEGEYLSPIFLDVAHKTKQYRPLSQRMIEKTFIQFSDSALGSFSINLSSEDIEKEGSQAFLKSMIQQYDVASRVTFEILESSFIHNQALLGSFISEFKSYGVRFAIDDFGSGYSNHRRVVDLDPDYIKIDGELIQYMLKDKKSYKMVENIASYAKEFHIRTVAEHIDSLELFEACKALGIDYFQGYLFAKPSLQVITKIELTP